MKDFFKKYKVQVDALDFLKENGVRVRASNNRFRNREQFGHPLDGYYPRQRGLPGVMEDGDLLYYDEVKEESIVNGEKKTSKQLILRMNPTRRQRILKEGTARDLIDLMKAHLETMFDTSEDPKYKDLYNGFRFEEISLYLYFLLQNKDQKEWTISTDELKKKIDDDIDMLLLSRHITRWEKASKEWELETKHYSPNNIHQAIKSSEDRFEEHLLLIAFAYKARFNDTKGKNYLQAVAQQEVLWEYETVNDTFYSPTPQPFQDILKRFQEFPEKEQVKAIAQHCSDYLIFQIYIQHGEFNLNITRTPKYIEFLEAAKTREELRVTNSIINAFSKPQIILDQKGFKKPILDQFVNIFRNWYDVHPVADEEKCTYTITNIGPFLICFSDFGSKFLSQVGAADEKTQALPLTFGLERAIRLVMRRMIVPKSMIDPRMRDNYYIYMKLYRTQFHLAHAYYAWEHNWQGAAFNKLFKKRILNQTSPTHQQLDDFINNPQLFQEWALLLPEVVIEEGDSFKFVPASDRLNRRMSFYRQYIARCDDDEDLIRQRNIHDIPEHKEALEEAIREGKIAENPYYKPDLRSLQKVLDQDSWYTDEAINVKELFDTADAATLKVLRKHLPKKKRDFVFEDMNDSALRDMLLNLNYDKLQKAVEHLELCDMLKELYKGKGPELQIALDGIKKGPHMNISDYIEKEDEPTLYTAYDSTIKYKDELIV